MTYFYFAIIDSFIYFVYIFFYYKYTFFIYKVYNYTFNHLRKNKKCFTTKKVYSTTYNYRNVIDISI